ncbi:ubiquitin-like protein Pup [Nesterenkonia aerolata]|uniref:Prokaryotic ubiquitin-like protein Pup n=1 Tax=Nesterenkonia aerolata TaxID=3074079 RepID=A0ABU2DQE8_9MICC|nr:ubiquitin-like protein Pup [Nesterenkonia sp. LY-0111]MDR8018626.1 ubiquitin-like protein Pup [Nesterenkonia sp. LY-0111]
MSTQPQKRSSSHGPGDEEPVEQSVPGAGNVQASHQAQELDSLLDEIDSVLETNAEEFVRGFVQKGGQ